MHKGEEREVIISHVLFARLNELNPVAQTTNENTIFLQVATELKSYSVTQRTLQTIQDLLRCMIAKATY